MGPLTTGLIILNRIYLWGHYSRVLTYYVILSYNQRGGVGVKNGILNNNGNRPNYTKIPSLAISFDALAPWLHEQSRICANFEAASALVIMSADMYLVGQHLTETAPSRTMSCTKWYFMETSISKCRELNTKE